VAMINAIFSGPGSSQVSADDAGGLESAVCLAKGARVMLTANLWVKAGLVDGAIGTVGSVCYSSKNESLQDLPLAVTDSCAGPTLSDNTVPICPIIRTQLSINKVC